MDTTAYTREEIQQQGDALPKRGPVCPKCGQHIPQFADLGEPMRFRLLQLIGQNQRLLATQELRAVTGCPLSWAKLWTAHWGRPDALGTTAPCPYCGKPLVTALAKQCRYCLMDWHEPQHPKKLA